MNLQSNTYRPAVAFFGVFIVAISILLFGFWRLQQRNTEVSRLGWPEHIPEDTYRWLAAVANAIERSPSKELVCPGMAVVAARLEARIRDRPSRRSLSFNPSLLTKAYPGFSCERLASRLAQTLGAEWKFLDSAQWRVDAPASRRSLFTRHAGRTLEVILDREALATASVWEGIKGDFRMGGGKPYPLTSTIQEAFATDEVAATWLLSQANKRLFDLKSGHTVYLNGRALLQAPDVNATLVPAYQATANALARCYTGWGCSDMPAGLPQPDRRIAAGFLAIVVVEVASGRVVAAASNWSKCARDNLGRNQKANASAAAKDTECANFPDARSLSAVSETPGVVLNFPTGSTAKPPLYLAGIRQKLINSSNEAIWRMRLACSQDVCGAKVDTQITFQDLALKAGPKELSRALDDLGFDTRSDPAYGHSKDKPLAILRRPPLSALDEPTLKSVSIGGAGITTSALGLATMMRRVVLASENIREARAERFFDSPGLAPASFLIRVSKSEADSLLELMSHVTDPAMHGTAAFACSRALGHCPAPGIVGKTGTADFLREEQDCRPKYLGHRNGKEYVLQYPAKLFAGAYKSHPTGGYTHVIGTVAFRVPEGRCLEKRNRAAEAALTFIRAQRNDLLAEFLKTPE